MFNFGWGELVVIGIVALIAIGPKELPTVLRTIGQAMGKIRRMANEFQGQFQEALREAEVADLQKHADDITSSVNKEMTDIASFDPLADTQKEIEKGFEMAEPATGADAPTQVSTDVPADAPAIAPPAETAAAEPAAAEPVKPLPEIDVPLPELPAPVTEKDFAAAEPPAAKAPKKRARGKA